VGRTAGAGSGRWYIQAAGKVWGPYPESRVAEFVGEGRVAPDTLMGSRPEGPFAPAAHQYQLCGLFGAAVQPLAEAVEPLGGRVAAEAKSLMVWASLGSQRTERFEALLGVYGPFLKVQPGLWLVRARIGAAGLRNALTRRLDAGDRLMVVEAELTEAAWFNLDGETDRALRQLWSRAD